MNLEKKENVIEETKRSTPQIKPLDINSSHYTTNNPFYISNPALKGQCTWYAAGRSSEINGVMVTFSRNSGRDAINWPSLVTNGTLSGTPQVGSVIIWANHSQGHVAVIEDIVAGLYAFSECNGDGNGTWNEGVDGVVQVATLENLKGKYTGFVTFINF